MKGNNNIIWLHRLCYELQCITDWYRAIVQRIIFEMQQRIDKLANEPELSMALEWIKRYLNLAQKHMITMDALQETILKEVISVTQIVTHTLSVNVFFWIYKEMVKLETDRHRSKEMDSLIEELVMRLHNSYFSHAVF